MVLLAKTFDELISDCCSLSVACFYEWPFALRFCFVKVAYVTTFDVQKPDSWPKRHLGLYSAGNKIIHSLKTDSNEVVSLCLLNRKHRGITRIKWEFYKNVQHKNFYGSVDPLVCKAYARQIQRCLVSSDADILLCPENAIPLASLAPDRPMVLWTDAVLGSLVDFYPYLSNLCAETRRNIHRMEAQALSRCSLVILTSQWAARSAHKIYGVPFSKLKVIPRGANQIHQFSVADVKSGILRRSHSPCQLLFIGVEWQRKGGDMALKVAQRLNDEGLATELHVVGCTPPDNIPDFVKVHGFINRETEAGKAQMNQMFQSAHFLIYPTKADALGMVLSEAASFGVPALASKVGGIPELVRADITGQTFAVDAAPYEYCSFVMSYMSNADRYQSLAYSTFENYKNNMSWPAVGEQARTAFRELLAS